jgi:hypothetical protein
VAQNVSLNASFDNIQSRREINRTKTYDMMRFPTKFSPVVTVVSDKRLVVVSYTNPSVYWPSCKSVCDRFEVRLLTMTMLITESLIISGTNGDFDLSDYHTHIWEAKIQRFGNHTLPSTGWPTDVSDYGQRNRRCSPKRQMFTPYRHGWLPENTSPHNSSFLFFFWFGVYCPLGYDIV